MKLIGDAASDPSGTFPADDYFLTCTAVQSKDKFNNDLKSKAGNDMWVLELTVAEGPYKGRKFDHYMVFLQAGKAGHGMVLRTLHAFGLQHEGEINVEPHELEGVTVKAKVGIQPPKDGYSAKNTVARWYVPGEEDAGSAQEPEKGGDTTFPPKEAAQEPVKPNSLAEKAAAAGLTKQPAPTKPKLWGGKKK